MTQRREDANFRGPGSFAGLTVQLRGSQEASVTEDAAVPRCHSKPLCFAEAQVSVLSSSCWAERGSMTSASGGRIKAISFFSQGDPQEGDGKSDHKCLHTSVLGNPTR